MIKNEQVKVIIKIVGDYFKDDILSDESLNSRFKKRPYHRQIASYLLQKNIELKLSEYRKLFKKSNRIVYYSMYNITDLYKFDKNVRRDIDILTKQINNIPNFTANRKDDIIDKIIESLKGKSLKVLNNLDKQLNYEIR